MSESETADVAESTPEYPESDDETDEDPDIEEDIVREKLRIDGICGVY